MHKKCSGLKRLKNDPDYRCTRCQGTACPLDGRPQKEVQVGPDKLEVVASFCYLGDMLSAAGGCELSITTRVKTAWKKHWVHKKCSGLKRLKNDPDYRCIRCQGTACPLDGRPQKEVQVGPDKLEVVASFCYLGDMLSAAGGCEFSTTTRVKTAWKKFKDLLPVLSSRHLSFKTRGRVYSSCVRSTMLHASETWPLTKPNLQRLQRNDRAMIRQICNVRPQDIVTTRSNELLVRLGIEDLDLNLKERRLRWYGHVERSNGAVKTAFDIQVDGKRGPGRPKMTWKQLTEGLQRVEALGYQPS